jgi:serine/threonine protein kinase
VTAPRDASVFPSDAPLAGEVTVGPGGFPRLKRRLDEPWRGDLRARQLLLAEIEANSRVPLASLPLVPLLSAGDAPEPWLQREYFDRGTLAHRIRAAAWPTGGELLTIASWLLSAADALESLGLTHGDPSPSNVFITAEGAVRLGDLASSRAAFAAGGVARKPALDGRTDRGRMLRWLLPLARRCDESDPLVRTLVGALAGGATEEMQVLRLRRLVEEREAEAAPVSAAPARPSLAPAAPPKPLLVAVVTGPAPDDKGTYLAAKHLAALTGRPVPDLRAEIRAGTALFEALYPGAATELADRFAALNVPVRIRRAGAPS